MGIAELIAWTAVTKWWRAMPIIGGRGIPARVNVPLQRPLGGDVLVNVPDHLFFKCARPSLFRNRGAARHAAFASLISSLARFSSSGWLANSTSALPWHPPILSCDVKPAAPPTFLSQ